MEADLPLHHLLSSMGRMSLLSTWRAKASKDRDEHLRPAKD